MGNTSQAATLCLWIRQENNDDGREQKSKLLRQTSKPDSTAFVWSKPAMDYLEAHSKRNNVALSDTQFTMLMCGMEHSLKLLLAKDHNLSLEPRGSRPSSWSLSWTL